MRVFKLTARFPYPPRSGAQLRDYNLIKQIAKTHDLTLFSFADVLPQEEDLEHMATICHRVQVVVGGHRSLRSALVNLGQSVPFHSTSFYSRQMHRILHDHVARNEMDLFDASFIFLTQYYPAPQVAVRVLDQHNSDRMVWQRIGQSHRSFLVRTYARLNLTKLKHYESRIYPTLAGVIAVSEQDIAITRQFAPPNLPMHLSPNGVDTKYFAPSSANPPEESNVLLILGGLNQLATIDAVDYFTRSIWPSVRAVRPDVELWLVGRSPAKQVKTLAMQPGIRLIGEVADVRPYYARATVVLAPYRLGGGTKLKVLNAMSMGKAVVATEIGAQGFHLGADALVINDGKEEYAANILALLDDPQRRHRMGTLAREEVVAKYDWEIIGQGYTAFLETVGSRKQERMPETPDIMTEPDRGK